MTTTPDWNVLVYAIATDPDEHKRVNEAVADMQATLTTDRCNIAVQLHAKGKPTRTWLSKGQKPQVTQLSAADVSEPETLTRFINAAQQKFPAPRTALLLWAHSSGLDHLHPYKKKARPRIALDGVFGTHDQSGLGGDPGLDQMSCPAPRLRSRSEPYGCRWGPDPNSGKYLTNVGMKKAIGQSRPRQRVDLLGLNACWMASLEVEYELRSVANVQVASQVYARPWPYAAIITALCADPDMSTEELAKEIVAAVRKEIAANQRKDTISALLSGAALDDLAAAFDAYAKRCMTVMELDWEAVLKAVTKEAQRVDDPYQVDLLSLVQHLGKHDLKAKIAAASVEAKYRAMLLGHAAHEAHPGVHGLSVLCPHVSDVDLRDAYHGTEFRNNTWTQFLIAFQIKLARQASA